MPSRFPSRHVSPRLFLPHLAPPQLVPGLASSRLVSSRLIGDSRRRAQVRCPLALAQRRYGFRGLAAALRREHQVEVSSAHMQRTYQLVVDEEHALRLARVHSYGPLFCLHLLTCDIFQELHFRYLDWAVRGSTEQRIRQ